MVIINAKKIVAIGRYKVQVKIVDTLAKNKHRAIKAYAKIIGKKK